MSIERLFFALARGASQGSQSYVVPGTYSWLCPPGVYSVSVLAVGNGSAATTLGGNAGPMSYANNIAVVPGQTYTVVIGTGVGSTYFNNTSTVSVTGASTTAHGTVQAGTGAIYDTNNVGVLNGIGGLAPYATLGISTSAIAGGPYGSGGSALNADTKHVNPGYEWTVAVAKLGHVSAGHSRFSQNWFRNGVQTLHETYIATSHQAATTDKQYVAGGTTYTNASPNPGKTGAVRIVWPGNTRTWPSTNVGNP